MSCDGQSRRVGRSVGGVLQKQFVWFDSTRLGAELNSSGAIVSQFIYGLKGNTPDYIIKGSTKYKVITDHLGSVVAVVNSSSGAVAQRLEYDEFGRVLVDTSPGFQPFGFAGGLYDTDTKLTLFGARSYDAEVGRWVSKDPILFAGGDANLYGYVLNDPVNWVDPEGLVRRAAEEGGGGVAGPRAFGQATPAQFARYSQQFSQYGQESLLKSRNSLERLIQQHEIKIFNARANGGYTSSMEREVRNFQNEINAIDKVIENQCK